VTNLVSLPKTSSGPGRDRQALAVAELNTVRHRPFVAVVSVLSLDHLLNQPSVFSATQPVEDAAHLARLLDRQPACLMRIGVDGLLLAVNDAAVGLLGADHLEHVLGGMIMDRLVPEHHDLWRDFVSRVWSAGSGSFECDMLDRTGARRSMDLQGIALADHPDGVRSLLVVARDVSSTRVLELALQEHEATHRALEQVRLELVQAKDSQARVDAALSERDADQQRAALTMDALREELERSLGEGRRLADQFAHQATARQQADEALTERDRECRNLQSVLKRYESDQQRLESDIEQSATEREQFEAMVKQRETTRQRTLVEHATARMHFERALTEATSRGERLARTLTDQSSELQNMGRQLESLAKQFGSPEGAE
jgi:hypothetical protein